MARFNFAIEDGNGLDDLAELTGRRSKADVVRDALSLYEHLIQRRRGGEKLYLGTNPKEVTEFYVTTLETAASKSRSSSTPIR